MLRTHNTLKRFNLPWWRFLLNMSFFLVSFLLHVVVGIFMALAFMHSLNRLTGVRGDAWCMHECVAHGSVWVDPTASYISDAPSPFLAYLTRIPFLASFHPPTHAWAGNISTQIWTRRACGI